MDALSQLIDALRCLPGIGHKSAQRMAFYLLQYQRQRGLHLATCLDTAMRMVKHCERCNNYTTEQQCNICVTQDRDPALLCVVESPADVVAIEQSHAYHGYYYVLMGKISPLDGIGPDDIGLPKLEQCIINHNVMEVILALSPTIEGQTTMHFIHTLLKPHALQITQPAHGLPSGGELEFLDGRTIGNALNNRANVVL